jgi:hypothetical protein
MSQNKLVSVKNVIVDLMDDLALDHKSYTPMFTNWAIRAEKKIGSYYQYKKKHAVLEIKGCHAELPCDCVYLQIGIMGDLGDCCTDIFDRTCGSLLRGTSMDATFANTGGFLVVDIGTFATDQTINPAFGFVQYEVQDNKIIFLNNYDGQSITIQYLGMEVDCDGIPLIGENHIEAIGQYCMWKFRMRRVRSGIDIGLYRDHKAEWERLCANARAEDAIPSDSDYRMITELVNDPHAGKSLWLGMHTTNGYYL